MSGMGQQGGGDGPDGPPRRGQPYIAPPHIRTTGEIPRVTGEVPPAFLPDPSTDHGEPEDEGQPWPSSGSVVDRPAPDPPGWMSGVQIPELLVTRELDPSEVVVQRRGGLVDTLQRLLGLVLVAVLVAVVVLVLVSSLTRF